ncbi:pilus assembly protein TadG-related protein [Kytococcus sp. Marseille-QA3725]
MSRTRRLVARLRAVHRPRRRDPEEGGTALLLMGFVAILASLLLVGVDTTSLYLARIETLNATDAAARGAADAISDDAYYEQEVTVLDPAEVDRAAHRALAEQEPSSRIAAWQVVSAAPTGDRRQATVRVTSEVHFPVTDLVRGWVPGGTTITVESTARGGDRNDR